MKQSKEVLKTYFETGDQPTQSQYEDVIDSFRHIDDGKVIKTFNQEEGRQTIVLSDDTEINFQVPINSENVGVQREDFFPTIAGNTLYEGAASGFAYKVGNRVDFTILYRNLTLETPVTSENLFIEGLPNFGSYIMDVDHTIFQVSIEKFSDEIDGRETSYNLSDAFAGVTTIGREVIYIKVKVGDQYQFLPKLAANNGEIRISGSYYLAIENDGRS